MFSEKEKTMPFLRNLKIEGIGINLSKVFVTVYSYKISTLKLYNKTILMSLSCCVKLLEIVKTIFIWIIGTTDNGILKQKRREKDEHSHWSLFQDSDSQRRERQYRLWF